MDIFLTIHTAVGVGKIFLLSMNQLKASPTKVQVQPDLGLLRSRPLLYKCSLLRSGPGVGCWGRRKEGGELAVVNSKTVA